MYPLPFLIFDPQGADCQDAVRLRNLIERNYPCRDGACGQGSQGAFEKARYKETGGSTA